MRGEVWPKFKNAPEEHMTPKVPVVTTSTFRAAPRTPSLATTSIISSAVTTTQLPARIFALISSTDFRIAG